MRLAMRCEGLFQAVTDKASSFAPPQDTKVNGPVDSLGIRGEGPQDTTSNVAELNGAASEATESLKQLASAASSASGSVGSSAPATATVHAAGGGLVQWLDSGGDVAGAGTATSDSIPAMLSDGEYVIKASSARKLGRGMLDHLNAGGGYADGGAVARKLAAVRRKYASGGAVNPSADSPDALPSGSYDVTPTDDGGAIINGVYYGAGAPLLQNPIIQKALQSARQEKQTDKKKYKSDFVGTFGSHAGGGPIGFSGGGAVGSGLDFSSLTHLAGGGPAPTLDSIGAGSPGGASGNLSVDLRTNHGDFRMMTSEDVARKMGAAARDAANASAGAAPSWEYGR
jgi:hypothetical protein